VNIFLFSISSLSELDWSIPGYVMIYNSSTPSQPMYGVMTSPTITVVAASGQSLEVAAFASAENMTLVIYQMDGQDQMTLKLADLTIPPGLWTKMSVCLPPGSYKVAFVGYDNGLADDQQFVAIDNVTIVNYSCNYTESSKYELIDWFYL